LKTNLINITVHVLGVVVTRNVTTRYVRVFAIANLSIVCLSSVTFVRPTQGVETSGNISLPFCTLAILWPPWKILRRSFQRKPFAGGVKRKRVSKI